MQEYIYYFHGADGCDICADLDGFYDEFTDDDRPHPNCTCEIEEWSIEDDCEVKYENEQEDVVDTYDEDEIIDVIINKSYKPIYISENFGGTITGCIDVSDEIEEIFNVSGNYEESLDAESLVEVKIPPRSSLVVKIVGELQTVEFSADRCFDCGGEEFCDDETITESIEAVESAEIETEIIPLEKK